MWTKTHLLCFSRAEKENNHAQLEYN
jgi:hypothetical protein